MYRASALHTAAHIACFANAPVSAVCTAGKENLSGSSSKGPKQQQQQQDMPARPPPPQQPGYVACPICSMSVREAFINSHVDTCLDKAGGVAAVAAPPPASSTKARTQQQQQQLGRPPAGAAARSSGGSTGGGGLARAGGSGGSNGAGAGVFGVLRARAKGGSPLEAPPKLCFELLKERELKAKLTALALSSDGNKKVRRQQELTAGRQAAAHGEISCLRVGVDTPGVLFVRGADS